MVAVSVFNTLAVISSTNHPPPSETSSWTGGMTSPSAEDIPGRAAGVWITLPQTHVRPVWPSVGVCDHRDVL